MGFDQRAALLREVKTRSQVWAWNTVFLERLEALAAAYPGQVSVVRFTSPQPMAQFAEPPIGYARYLEPLK